MNVYDSAIIGRLVKNIGFNEVDSANEAEMVVLNTCHIREKASEKVYSELGVINALQKRQKRKIIIVVAGCVSQAEGSEIIARSPYVDIVVGPQSLHTLPELVTKIDRDMGKVVNVDFVPEEKFDYLAEESVKTGDVSAFVSIQEGCDKFCTYCVVPYTRGAEYSRSVESIYTESCRLVESGVKEITLLGQNVNGYHGKLGNELFSLGKLLKYLARLDGLERIRYTTSHPSDMHDELYDAHANCPKVMPFINLPIQSGSNNVLRMMNRKHKVAEYLDVVEKMHSVRSDVVFSSDFIVGFSGEMDKDFQETIDVIKQIGFVHGYSFKYSIRPGTPGAEYKNQVPEEVKSQRLQIMQEILKEQKLNYNCSFIGKTMKVLFDAKREEQSSGRTPYMQSVFVNDLSCYGKLLDVKITDAFHNSIVGEVV